MEANCTILYVKNADVQDHGICDILKDSYSFVSFPSLTDAIAAFEENSMPFSLLMVEENFLKGINDLLTQRIRTLSEKSNVPVVVLAKEQNDENEMKALSIGACGYFFEPFNVSIVKKKIENIVSLRRSFNFLQELDKDSLTGVYTKETFFSVGSQLIKDNPDYCYKVACVGIDSFRIVNEMFGEDKGDEILASIGKSLIEIVSASNGIAGRTSGDLFVLMIPSENCCNEVEGIKKILDDIKKCGLPINVRVKMGFFVSYKHKVQLRVMYERAKLALKSIKGRYDVDFAYYDKNTDLRLMRENQILSHMYKALNNGEFKVFFQPKFDIITNEMAGAEALVRWFNPDLGFMSPDDFIPLFESNGFITLLDKYVWESVCQKISKWQSQDIKRFHVSVNVSRNDAYDENLVDFIYNLCKKYNIETHFLHLEITETAYTKSPDQIVKTVERLKDKGFIIEMDDFGIGYSSLTMLGKLPVDTIKLDASFLRNRKESTRADIITKTVVSLANELSTSVVAEGVETSEDLDYLISHKCKFAQGYKLAKPMNEEEFERYIKMVPIRKYKDPKEKEYITFFKNSFNENQYIHKVNEFVFEFNILGRIEIFTKDFIEKFGYADLLTNSDEKPLFSTFIHTDDRQQFENMMTSFSQGERILRRDLRILREDGEAIWCRIEGQSAFDKSGNAKGVVAIVADIEQEKVLLEKVDLMEIMSLDRIDSNRKSFIDDVSVSLYVNHYKGILAVAYIQSDKMCDRNLSNESLMKMEEAMNSIFARDDKTGNFGNGEFVIFTYSCSDEEELKKRISQAAVMADLNDVEIFLGCAFVSEDLREFSLLYEKADNNMLKIKGTK